MIIPKIAFPDLKPALGSRSRVPARELSGPKPAVTVVIPCHNYGRFLRQAVGSSLDQTEVRVDVIVIDDASTDDSLSVARDIARSDPRVRVLANAVNTGPVGAFNRGLEEASGEFLVRLDADDLLTPGALARAVAVARAFPSVGLVYGHPLHFSGEDLPEPRLTASGWTLWPGRQWLEHRCRQGFNVITSPEVVMRMATVRMVGGQQPLPHAHDMEMWLRLAAFSDVAYIHGADQAWHRQHPHSLSARKVDIAKDLDERKKAFETLFEGPAGNLPEARQLHLLARRALVRSALSSALHELDRGTQDCERVQWFLRAAETVDPEVNRSALWRRLQRRAAQPSVSTWRRFGPTVRRATAKALWSWRWRQWHRNGVFGRV